MASYIFASHFFLNSAMPRDVGVASVNFIPSVVKTSANAAGAALDFFGYKNNPLIMSETWDNGKAEPSDFVTPKYLIPKSEYGKASTQAHLAQVRQNRGWLGALLLRRLKAGSHTR